MTLDPQSITPLQSDTIKAALKAIAVNGITLLAVLTGKAFDVDAVNQSIDLGAPIAVSLINLYYSVRVIQGRINATKTIAKKE
jgi:hypothetical protein